jgi:hypothetical protein
LRDRHRSRLVFTWISPATRQKESLISVEFRAGHRTTEVVVTHEQPLLALTLGALRASSP